VTVSGRQMVPERPTWSLSWVGACPPASPACCFHFLQGFTMVQPDPLALETLVAEAAESPAPSKLRMERRLAAGGFATVYRGVYGSMQARAGEGGGGQGKVFQEGSPHTACNPRSAHCGAPAAGSYGCGIARRSGEIGSAGSRPPHLPLHSAHTAGPAALHALAVCRQGAPLRISDGRATPAERGQGPAFLSAQVGGGGLWVRASSAARPRPHQPTRPAAQPLAAPSALPSRPAALPARCRRNIMGFIALCRLRGKSDDDCQSTGTKRRWALCIELLVSWGSAKRAPPRNTRQLSVHLESPGPAPLGDSGTAAWPGGTAAWSWPARHAALGWRCVVCVGALAQSSTLARLQEGTLQGKVHAQMVSPHTKVYSDAQGGCARAWGVPLCTQGLCVGRVEGGVLISCLGRQQPPQRVRVPAPPVPQTNAALTACRLAAALQRWSGLWTWLRAWNTCEGHGPCCCGSRCLPLISLLPLLQPLTPTCDTPS